MSARAELRLPFRLHGSVHWQLPHRRLSLLHQLRVVRRGLAGGAGVVRRRERERAAAGGDAEALLALPRR